MNLNYTLKLSINDNHSNIIREVGMPFFSLVITCSLICFCSKRTLLCCLLTKTIIVSFNLKVVFSY